MNRTVFGAALLAALFAIPVSAFAQTGDAAGHAQSTGPARANPAVGRTEKQPGSAPTGERTSDPGQATETGSPGSESVPGTAAPSTGDTK